MRIDLVALNRLAALLTLSAVSPAWGCFLIMALGPRFAAKQASRICTCVSLYVLEPVWWPPLDFSPLIITGRGEDMQKRVVRKSRVLISDAQKRVLISDVINRVLISE